MNAKKNKMSDAPAAAEQQATTATENPESQGNAQQLPSQGGDNVAVRAWEFVWPEWFLWPEGFHITDLLAAGAAAHEANKAYCESIGDMSQPEWNDAPDWQRDSAMNGVCFAIQNSFPSPEQMHENWMKEKLAAGWVYGEVKNPDAVPPTHHCLVPYEQLPEAQRKKDDLFRSTIMKVLGVADVPAEPPPPTAEEKAMASMLECAAAMCGLISSGEPIFPGPVAMCLADYFRQEPAAPAAGGLSQLKLKLNLILLPNEDPRRVGLMLELFRLAVTRLVQFADDDARAEAARRQAAAMPTAHNRLEGDGPFDRDGGRFEKSDLGKSLANQKR